MKRILIIDDETSVRILLKKMLEKEDYEVFEAQDGNKGMDLYKKFNPDLIITDLVMPEKEGLETIRELRKENSEIVIFAISGGGRIIPDTYLNLAEKLGANRTFSKPFDTDEMLSAIKAVWS